MGKVILSAGTGKIGIPKDELVLTAMECGIYLFVLLMFAGRFGTLRELGLYLPAFLWLLRGITKKNFDMAWREPLFVAVLALFLSAAASSMFAAGPAGSFMLLKKEYIKMLLLYGVISTTFVSYDRLNRLALFMASAGVLYLIAGFSKITMDMIRSGSIDYDQTRYYATIFLFFLPFFLLQSERSQNVKRALWKVPLIGAVAGIILTGVRGSWLGLLGVIGMWIYFLRSRFRNVFIALGAGTAVVAFVIFAIVIIFPGQYRLVKDHLKQRSPVSYRLETWKLYTALSLERPLIGHGLDSSAMMEHYRESYKIASGTYPSDDRPTTPHNQFIKILYQQGITGLTVYVLLFVVFFYRIVKAYLGNRDGDLSLLGISVGAAVMGEYVIRCLTEDRSLIPLGLLLSMAGAYLNLRKQEEREEAK